MTGLLMSTWWNSHSEAGPENPPDSDFLVPKPALQLLSWQGNNQRPTVPQVIRDRSLVLCRVWLNFFCSCELSK